MSRLKKSEKEEKDKTREAAIREFGLPIDQHMLVNLSLLGSADVSGPPERMPLRGVCFVFASTRDQIRRCGSCDN